MNAQHELISGHWFLAEQGKPMLLPHLSRLLKGESASLGNDPSEGEKKSSTMLAEGVVEFHPYFHAAGLDDYPEEITAVVPVVGPVMKYGYWFGTVDMVKTIRRLDASPKVKKIILRIDSPGGTVAGTRDMYDALVECQKPTMAYVDDLAASAALWIAAGCDSIWANNSTAEIGSIGVYTTLADWNAYYESLGLKVVEIYSNLSGEKNKIYLDALKGKDGALKSKLDRLATEFIATIKERRPNITGNPFKGAMYYADEAAAMGLIDGIGSMADMLAGNNRAETPTPQPRQTQISNMNIAASIASFFGIGKKTAVTAEQVAEINGQLATDGLPVFVVAATEEIPNAAALQAGMDALGAEVTRLTSELATAQASVSTLTTERDNARAESSSRQATIDTVTAAFGENAQAEGFDLAASVTQAVADANAYVNHPAGGAPEGTAARSTADVDGAATVNIDDLPHNKLADEMGYGKQAEEPKPATK